MATAAVVKAFASDWNSEEFFSSSETDALVIFKGKKYNWQVKNELHIHVVEHLFLDCFEVIGL